MDLKIGSHVMNIANTSTPVLEIQDTMNYGKETRAMADVKWIKITTDIFSDEKILLIEQLPEADTIIVIWFKLLCMAGRDNNNGIFVMNNRMPYTEEMLATLFRRPLPTVRLALATFEAYGMIDIVDDVYTIPNWDKHQNVDGMEKIREQGRLRQQRYREKQKLLLGDVTSNATVTQSNALDKDKEEDKDKDKDKELYKSIVEYLNQKAGTHYKPSSKSTQTKIHARLNEGFTLDDFKTVIDKKVAEWKGTEMEQYLRPETLFGTKFEGYLNAKIVKGKPKGPTNSFNNFPQRDYDFKELEKKLLAKR